MKLYLAHPFQSRVFVRNWQKEMNKKLNGKISFTNPFYSKYKRDIEKWSKGDTSSNKTYKKLNPESIVTRDINLIARQDGIVAFIDGNISYGTIQEMVYSTFLHKDVLSVISNGQHNHPWLKFHSTKVFTELNKLEEYLENSIHKT